MITVSAWDTPTNQVYANTNTDIRSITSRVSNGNQGIGGQGCHAGYGSNAFNCGQIDMVDTDHLVTEPDGTVRWQNHNWRLNVPASGGDSGGPVMYVNAAMGLAEAGTTTTWYSTIDWASSALGYRPCITATTNPCQ